ncbi:MAG: amidohydrolase [Chitinophagales bacterium]|nr:amidohydrolase [Chitinophagales bacterium]
MHIGYSFLAFVMLNSFFLSAQISNNKKEAINTIDKNAPQMISMSDSIWAFAEMSMKEFKSSELLADYAEAQGFKVTRNAADIPTAFIAEYGSGKPIIGILGEFDALPGLSQQAVPYKTPLEENAPGHGCGHNMFGAASLGAAIAIKELMVQEKIKGTIRFYGTPAEEDYAGKVYMARAGLFNDLDVCLDWHPDYEIKANTQSSKAVIDYTVSFKGKSAHAALDPWNGRSALDAAELFTTGINFYREHVRPTARMHYVYLEGGEAPNVIPDKASVWIWLRDDTQSDISILLERMKDIAQGAALMAGVDYELTMNSGLYEVLINMKGAEAMQKNLEILGPITYTNEEIEFANMIMKSNGNEEKGISGKINPIEATFEHPEGGSTDVGDVSWIVPEIGLVVTTAPFKSPWHSWVVVACGGMSIGHKGMLFASKAMAMTMVDLFEDENLRNEIRAEFEMRKGDKVWVPLLPEGPPKIRE